MSIARTLEAFCRKAAAWPSAICRRSRLVQTDVRKLNLGTRFPLPVATDDSPTHLLTADQLGAALLRIRNHLITGGRLLTNCRVRGDTEQVSTLDRTPPPCSACP